MFEYKKWSQAIQPDIWLNAIREDIKDKYAIDNPQFSFDDVILDRISFDVFITPPFYWVKYKRKPDNTFELKPFSPWPSDAVSKKLIDNFLHNLINSKQAKYFCINKYFDACNDETDEWDFVDEPGETFYTITEAKVELLSLLRRGFSKIEFVKETLIEEIGEKAYHLHVSQDSIENMLKSGYLELEYK